VPSPDRVTEQEPPATHGEAVAAPGEEAPVATHGAARPDTSDGFFPPDEGKDGLEEVLVADRYRVLRRLGAGGMGVVYLAEHVAIEKRVALKVLLHEYSNKPVQKERFLREAKAAAKINHPNVVDITDFGETPDGRVFFAMEYLEGEDLHHVIRRGGALPWARARPILLQICSALGSAHAKGIIHRDLKPENIKLVSRGEKEDFVKLLDFGIARITDLGDAGRRLTKTGMIFGTPEYMSPEQASGERADHRADLYALGLIMYEMLTGKLPFSGDNFMAILTKHLHVEPVPPRELNPTICPEAEAIVLRALAKDRDARFQSMEQMAAAIASIEADPARVRILEPLLDPESMRATTEEELPVPVESELQPAPVSESASSLDLAPARSPWRSLAPMIVGVIVLGGLVAFAGIMLFSGPSQTAKQADAGSSRTATFRLHTQDSQIMITADASSPSRLDAGAHKDRRAASTPRDSRPVRAVRVRKRRDARAVRRAGRDAGRGGVPALPPLRLKDPFKRDGSS
jgi:serine/threonine protein kinase